MKKLHLSWNQIEYHIDQLVHDIETSKKKYDWVIGINRGGLIPSVRISHRLKISHGVITTTHYVEDKMLDEVKKDFNISGIKDIKHHHNILLVDDIADSGICLKETIEAVRQIDLDINNIQTATLFYKPKSIIKPNYFAEEIEDKIWIVFPWEEQKLKNAVGV